MARELNSPIPILQCLFAEVFGDSLVSSYPLVPPLTWFNQLRVDFSSVVDYLVDGARKSTIWCCPLGQRLSELLSQHYLSHYKLGQFVWDVFLIWPTFFKSIMCSLLVDVTCFVCCSFYTIFSAKLFSSLETSWYKRYGAFSERGYLTDSYWFFVFLLQLLSASLLTAQPRCLAALLLQE